MQINFSFSGDTLNVQDVLFLGLVSGAFKQYAETFAKDFIDNEDQDEEPCSTTEEPTDTEVTVTTQEQAEPEQEQNVEEPKEEAANPMDTTDELPFPDTHTPSRPLIDEAGWRAALKAKRDELGITQSDSRNGEFLNWIHKAGETFGDRIPSHLSREKLTAFVNYFNQLAWSEEEGFHVPAPY